MHNWEITPIFVNALLLTAKNSEIMSTEDLVKEYLSTEGYRFDVDGDGDIHFKLWNINTEECLPMTKISIEGQETLSDENGIVTLFIPLPRQRKAYKIRSDLNLINDSIVMPCGADDVVLVK